MTISVPPAGTAAAPTPPAARLLMAKIGHLEPGRWAGLGMCSDFWRYYNNRDAGGFVTIGGQRHDLEPGRSYVIPSGVTFDFLNVATIRHLFLHFDAPLLAAASHLVVLDADVVIDATARRLHGDLGRDPQPPGVQSRLASLLHAALAQMLDDGTATLARTDPTLAPALSHIDAHLGEPLLNRTLAALCHLSEDHFIRRFREEHGTPPATYVRRRRIAEAAYRLLYTSRSIDAIAADLGFGTRSSFDRTFRAVTGTPPATYRRTVPRA